MLNNVEFIVLIVTTIGVTVSYGGLVDLRPDEKGDRIAVVEGEKVAYLPARRVNMELAEQGSSGECRYIRRSSNGDLFVTGPALGDRMFRSTDGGRSWTNWQMDLAGAGRIGAFTILGDDTFLMICMPTDHRGNRQCTIGRSTDHGRTWNLSVLGADLEPFNYMNSPNSELRQLSDGTVLLTLDVGMGPDNMKDDEGRDLPVHQRGVSECVFRSIDGGKTWPHKSMLTQHGAETHLLQLPSGKVLACIRKQRWHRLPGDPASVLQLKQQYGYDPIVDGGLMEDREEANRIKNMFVSESYDGGHTWVNEQQVSAFMKCPGDMSFLKDGTLVLQYLHRYDDSIAREGIRARVSHDEGKTWEPQEYVLSDGIGRYPGGIDMPDGSMISICPHAGQLQAVHWRPLAKDKPALTYVAAPQQEAAPAPLVVEQTEIAVITGDRTTTIAATRSNILPASPPGVRHSMIRYGRNSAILQRAGNGHLYCTGNVLGPYAMVSKDDGRTWSRRDFDLPAWGGLAAFRILRDGSFLIIYEPVGGQHGALFTARSTDDGGIWKVRTTDVEMGSFTQVSGSDNNMVELEDGTLLLVLQLWGGQDGSGDAAPGTETEALACVLRSTDGGETWGKRAALSGLTGKARLVSLGSGKLLACVYKFGAKQLMLAESHDDGRTWTNSRPIPAGVNPGGETGNLTRLGDGTVVLQFLYDQAAQKNIHDVWYTVEGLRAIVSHDEGETWEDQVYVIGRQIPSGQEPTGQGAYLGDSVELSDGRILTTCVNHVGSGMRLQAITWQLISKNP